MKILIVDDSALMRTTISDILSSLPNAQIKSSRDGVDALEKLMEWQPDVITLDINMPRMDGLTCLSHIMTMRPTPVVVLSSLTQDGAVTTLEALHMGAVDYATKPGGTICGRLKEISSEIRAKVQAAANMCVQFNTSNQPTRQSKSYPEQAFSHSNLAIIGASTGGPGSVEALLRNLSADFPLPVIVVQHMPDSFTAAFAQRLNRCLPFDVMHMNRALPLEASKVYVCNGDRDAIVAWRKDTLVGMPTPQEAQYNWHPSISKMVASAIRCCGADNLLCVMMTGMGNDGANEMTHVAKNGGVVYVQTPDSCVVPSMPESVLAQVGGLQMGTPERLSSLMMQGVQQLAGEVEYGAC